MLGIVCQICAKRPATSHLTELDPATGARLELHICATCVDQLELTLSSDPPPIAEVLAKKAVLDQDAPQAAAAGAAAKADASAAEREANSAVCPSCGLGFAEFAAHNRFGCAQCYAAFILQVEPLLARYHGSSMHTGRLPAASRGREDDLVARRARLDGALREAVAAEDYARAARLRDELRQLDESAP
jgi:protein arginine kinase activator